MATEDRVIVIRGPFTNGEIARLMALLQEIEGRRPDETFQLIVDDREAGTMADDALELIRQVNPLRPGYRRVIETAPNVE